MPEIIPFEELSADERFTKSTPDARRKILDNWVSYAKDQVADNPVQLDAIERTREKQFFQRPTDYGIALVNEAKDPDAGKAAAKAKLDEKIPVLYNGRAMLYPDEKLSIDEQLALYNLRPDGLSSDDELRRQFNDPHRWEFIKNGLTTAGTTLSNIWDATTMQLPKEVATRSAERMKVDEQYKKQVVDYLSTEHAFDPASIAGLSPEELGSIMAREANRDTKLQAVNTALSNYSVLAQNAGRTVEGLYQRMGGKKWQIPLLMVGPGALAVGAAVMAPKLFSEPELSGKDRDDKLFGLFAESARAQERAAVALRQNAQRIATVTATPIEDYLSTADGLSWAYDPQNALMLAGTAMSVVGKTGKFAKAAGTAAKIGEAVEEGSRVAEDVASVGSRAVAISREKVSFFDKVANNLQSIETKQLKPGSTADIVGRAVKQKAIEAGVGVGVDAVESIATGSDFNPASSALAGMVGISALRAGAKWGIRNLSVGKIFKPEIAESLSSWATTSSTNSSKLFNNFLATAPGTLGRYIEFAGDPEKFLGGVSKLTKHDIARARLLEAGVTASPEEISKNMRNILGWDYGLYKAASEETLKGSVTKWALGLPREVVGDAVKMGALNFAFGYVASGGQFNEALNAGVAGLPMGIGLGQTGRVTGRMMTMDDYYNGPKGAERIRQMEEQGLHVPAGALLGVERNPVAVQAMKNHNARWISTAPNDLTKQVGAFLNETGDPERISALWDITNAEALTPRDAKLAFVTPEHFADGIMVKQGFEEFVRRRNIDAFQEQEYNGVPIEDLEQRWQDIVDDTYSKERGYGARPGGMSRGPLWANEHDFMRNSDGSLIDAILVPVDPKLEELRTPKGLSALVADVGHETAHRWKNDVGRMRGMRDALLNDVVSQYSWDEILALRDEYLQDVEVRNADVPEASPVMEDLTPDEFSKLKESVADELLSAFFESKVAPEASNTPSGLRGWALDKLTEIKKDHPSVWSELALGEVEGLAAQLTTRGVELSPTGHPLDADGNILTLDYIKRAIGEDGVRYHPGILARVANYILARERYGDAISRAPAGSLVGRIPAAVKPDGTPAPRIDVTQAKDLSPSVVGRLIKIAPGENDFLTAGGEGVRRQVGGEPTPLDETALRLSFTMNSNGQPGAAYRLFGRAPNDQQMRELLAMKAAGSISDATYDTIEAFTHGYKTQGAGAAMTFTPYATTRDGVITVLPDSKIRARQGYIAGMEILVDPFTRAQKPEMFDPDYMGYMRTYKPAFDAWWDGSTREVKTEFAKILNETTPTTKGRIAITKLDREKAFAALVLKGGTRTNIKVIDQFNLNEKFRRLQDIKNGDITSGDQIVTEIAKLLDTPDSAEAKRWGQHEWRAANEVLGVWGGDIGKFQKDFERYFETTYNGGNYEVAGLSKEQLSALHRWFGYMTSDTNRRDVTGVNKVGTPVVEPAKGLNPAGEIVPGNEIDADPSRPSLMVDPTLHRTFPLAGIDPESVGVVRGAFSLPIHGRKVSAAMSPGKRLPEGGQPKVQPTTPESSPTNAQPTPDLAGTAGSSTSSAPADYAKSYKTWMQSQARWMVQNMPDGTTPAEFLKANPAGFKKLAEAYEAINPKPLKPEATPAATPETPVEQLAAPTVPEISQPAQAAVPTPEQQKLAEVVQRITEPPAPAATPEPVAPVEPTPASTGEAVPLTDQIDTATVSKPKATRSKKRTMVQEIQGMGYKSVDDFIRKNPEGYQAFADKWTKKKSKAKQTS